MIRPVIHSIGADQWSTCPCGWTSSSNSVVALTAQMASHRKWCIGRGKGAA